MRYTALGDDVQARRLLEPMREAVVETILASAGPGTGAPQTIVELRMLGGALAREPRHRSVLCHRDAAYSLAVIGVLPPLVVESVIGHSADLVTALAPWSTGGQMPNFAVSGDPGRPARCYADDTLHWLIALAKRYDPAGVLR